MIYLWSDNASLPELKDHIKKLVEVTNQAKQTSEVMLQLKATEPQQWAAITYPIRICAKPGREIVDMPDTAF